MVISLLLAIALSIVGISLLMTPPTSATAGDAGSLLRLDPSEVAKIIVDDRSTPTSAVVIRTGSGGWTIHLTRDGRRLTTPWPAEPTRVRSIVRTLCDLRSDGAAPESVVRLIEPALTVTIEMTDGRTHTVVIDNSSLGGMRAVEIDGAESGEVDDVIYRALTSPGPAGWRVMAPLLGVGDRTSRVSVRSPGQGAGVELAKTEGRWRLRQPVQARADEEAAEALLRSISALTIERFIDDPSSIAETEAGLDEPRLLVRVEEDRRTFDSGSDDIRTETRVQTLAIGGPADLTGKLVFTSINRGETYAVCNIEPIAAVSLSGEAYLSPAAAEAIEQNIGGFSVRLAGQPEARYERGIEGWRRLDATGATVGEAPSEPIESLLTALTVTPATTIVTEAPEGYRPIASVTLFDFGGGPMETIEAGRNGDGALAFRSGQVFRLYEDASTPALLAPGGLR